MLANEQMINFKNDLPIETSIQKITHQETHYHDNAVELIFCLEGTVSLRASHRHVTLQKNDVYSMDVGDIHCLYSDCDNLILIVHLNTLNEFVSKERLLNCFFHCETLNMRYFQKESMYKVKDLMLAAALLDTNDDYETSDDHKEITGQLIDLLINHFDWLSFIWDPMGDNHIFQERIHRILRYCMENYSHKISVSSLARREHINENYFSSFMKKTSFYNFSSMLNFIRCDGAERLLLTTDENIIEISSICGFSDPKYFYKHFREWWKISPAKLRKWYREYESLPVEEYTLTKEEAAQSLKEFMCDYHLQRTFNK